MVIRRDKVKQRVLVSSWRPCTLYLQQRDHSPESEERFRRGCRVQAFCFRKPFSINGLVAADRIEA